MKDYIEFPVIYTFKTVGTNGSCFESGIKDIFAEYNDASIISNVSSGGKYISISTTVEIKDYEELESVYTKISKTEGLKFHV